MILETLPCVQDGRGVILLRVSFVILVSLLLTAAVRNLGRPNLKQKRVNGIYSGYKEGRGLGLIDVKHLCSKSHGNGETNIQEISRNIQTRALFTVPLHLQ